MSGRCSYCPECGNSVCLLDRQQLWPLLGFTEPGKRECGRVCKKEEGERNMERENTRQGWIRFVTPVRQRRGQQKGESEKKSQRKVRDRKKRKEGRALNHRAGGKQPQGSLSPHKHCQHQMETISQVKSAWRVQVRVGKKICWAHYNIQGLEYEAIIWFAFRFLKNSMKIAVNRPARKNKMSLLSQLHKLSETTSCQYCSI